MSALVGDKPAEVDWLIQPGKGLIGDFRASYDGVAWDFPDGVTAWLDVLDSNSCNKKRYDFTVEGNRLFVHIPEAEAAKMEDRSKFRIYIQYPGQLEPLYWGEGRGVRDGW